MRIFIQGSPAQNEVSLVQNIAPYICILNIQHMLTGSYFVP